MPNISLERDNIAALVTQTFDGLRHEGFDPTDVTTLAQGPDESDAPLYLRGTIAFPSIPEVGNFCVAVFGLEPRLEPTAPTDVITHRSCDKGMLLRRPVQAEIEEADILNGSGESRAMSSRNSWVLQLLTRSPDSPSILVPTEQKITFRQSAL